MVSIWRRWVWNTTRVAFNLPSFYLLFLLPLGPSGRYSKESLHQVKITKVTPTCLKEPFKGEPPGTGKLWWCHRQFRKVAISSCLWTPGLTPECYRILIMILKTLRTESKDRSPSKFHQKFHKTQKTSIKQSNDRNYGYYSQYWKIESSPLRQEKANSVIRSHSQYNKERKTN